MVGSAGIRAVLALVVATHVGAQQPTSAAATQPQNRGVPNVTGLPLDSARRVLSANRLLPRVEAKSDGSRAAGTDVVAQQRPQPGQSVPFNRLVSLTLRVTPTDATGGNDVPPASQQLVPNIVGLSIDSAQRVLGFNKLRMRMTTTPRGINTLPSDVVTQQSPLARQPVPRDRYINADVAVDVIRVPDVMGFTQRSARSQLSRFDVRFELVPNAATPNTVFRQEPAASTLARPGTVVSVYLAQAIPVVQRAVPNVVGRQVQDAGVILSQTGFQTGRVTDDDDASVAPGVVVAQNPRDGLRVDPGTRVDLTVRSNRVRVPAVLALSETDARQQIAASGLQVGSVELREDSATSGTVIQQSLVARTLAERGSLVSITIAKPVAQAVAPPTPTIPQRRDSTPAPVTVPTATQTIIVPDIVGLPRGQAEAVASRAGFTFVVAPGQSARDADTVVKQFPVARSTMPAGSLVLMAEFNATAVTPTRPLWVIWLALAIPIVAAAATVIKKKMATAQQIAFPPITYTAGAKPPTFSIEDRRLTRGLELTLSVKNDPGAQAVSPRSGNAG